MKRMKHKTVSVKPETSTFRPKDSEEHDLAYYIHDRVELMHQVFSVIKSKELKAMIPQCVKNISLDDLQELCTEELLGISSKRLCAILDGANPPSDTESSSSSPDQVETISLDSISSDDEVLSQTSSKNKKHKHRKRRAKNKHKKQETEKKGESSGEEKNRASRAGLTVLELLELQARARAIRAQLQKDQINRAPENTENTVTERSDDEVEIKEEPAEVVEISSEDEKPNVEQLNAHIQQKTIEPEKTTNNQAEPNTVTKRINDLIITVPQSKQTRKIKLNRNKIVACETVATASNNVAENRKEENKTKKDETVKAKDPKKSKTKKKNKNKVNKKDGSDHDEITLQLSDTEKMDLLEDLDRKNYDSVSSSSKDSEDSSESSDESSNHPSSASDLDENNHKKTEDENETIHKDGKPDDVINNESETDATIKSANSENVISVDIVSTDLKDNKKMSNHEDVNISEESNVLNNLTLLNNSEGIEEVSQTKDNTVTTEDGELIDNQAKNNDGTENNEKKLSDGELSEESVVASVTEVVCVSDEEKTKKKKDKKSKKKSKKNSAKEKECATRDESVVEILTLNDEDDDEIFALSDDSSCYEVEGVSVLSKEPTTIEIEALSAKVDDTLREEISKEAEDSENLPSEKEDAENVSWKDRYLDSKKVKRVLKTSKILNALRKKNKELKKKLEESKQIEKTRSAAIEAVEEEKEKIEGTIDEYNNLEGSTKYVDPVSEKPQEGEGVVTEVTKEMEKDAKQLLKMYKRLLKYNDMHKQKVKDPNQKKVKKSKKKKEKNKDKSTVKANNTETT